MDYGLRMMMGGGFYFWLIPLLLILVVIYSGFKAFWPRNKSVKDSIKNSQSSLETLKIRYAKGEISWEEFEKIKSKLVEDK